MPRRVKVLMDFGVRLLVTPFPQEEFAIDHHGG
jgi:hypothetical protein